MTLDIDREYTWIMEKSFAGGFQMLEELKAPMRWAVYFSRYSMVQLQGVFLQLPDALKFAAEVYIEEESERDRVCVCVVEIE